MNRKFAQAFRLPSLLLAAALQILPIVRAALPATETAVNMLAIVFRWVAGTAAALGGVQAVSGASTMITNPLNVKATNGVPFSLRLTTAPDQAHYWTASGLPAGLRVDGTNGQTFWRILGTPTATGVYRANLTAKDQMNSGSSLTVSAVLTIDVTSIAIPPTIATSPFSQTVAQGQTATFTVFANGTAPLIYQWRFQGAPLNGKTNTNLALPGVTPANEGNYDVVVTNAYGSVTSAVASLKVVIPPALLTQPGAQTVTQGENAFFNVTTTGSAPLTYFWRKDTTVIAVVPNPSWTVTNAQPADAGNYSVIVSNSAGTATSATAALAVNPAPQAPFISSAPTNRAVVLGSPTTFTVIAGGTIPLQYEWYFNGALVPGETAPSYSLPAVQPADLGSYFVVVTNSLGSVTSAVASLSLIAPPQIVVPPQSQTNTTGGSAVFTVMISSVAPVGYQWEKDGAALLNNPRISGTRSNSLSVTSLQTNDAGNYLVIVTNVAGAVTSKVAELTVTLPPIAPLLVLINGAGSVAPDYNGQLLQIGRNYNITALPAAGNVFVGWSGGVTASVSALTFVMQSNLVLHANFAPGFLTFTKGTFNGLFSESTGARLPSSGAIAVTTTAQGKFTATAIVAGRKYAWSGRFDASGRATNVVKRTAPLNPLRVELELDPADPDQLHGTVTDGSWVAQLLADRGVFNATTFPCPHRGRYTVTIPGKPGATDVPQGDGFSTAIVNAAGQMTLAGKLADGVKFTRSAPVSKAGQWPWHVPLYSHSGMILSWQTFTNRMDDDLNGHLIWIRGQQPSAPYYPLGFTIALDTAGSAYLAPAIGAPAWSATPGHYELTGGNLAQNLAAPVFARSNNQLVGTDTNRFALVLTLKSGTFTGTFVNPTTGKTVSFSGVWLQKRDEGSGFFLGPRESGRAVIAR